MKKRCRLGWRNKGKPLGWNWEKKKKAVLAKLGVSELEAEVMYCPHCRLFGTPEELARMTVEEYPHRTSHTADDYLPVIYRMIEKGWFRLQEGEPRSRGDNLPVVPTAEIRQAPPGSVVFTEEGYLLDRKIHVARYGLKFVQRSDSFCKVRKEARQIIYYAPTRQICQEWIYRMSEVTPDQKRILYILGHPARILRVRGPEKTGKWQPSTHYTYRSGYRAIVHYARLRPKRIKVPKLSLHGTIEDFGPIRIEGTIGDNTFSFEDRPDWAVPPYDGKVVFNVRDWSFSTSARPPVVFDWSFSVYGDPPEASLSGKSKSPDIGAHPLYHLGEEGASPRRRMLSVAQAKEILASCARKYLEHRGRSQ